MSTTIDNITTDQIRSLSNEAGKAGDTTMRVIADVALGHDPNYAADGLTEEEKEDVDAVLGYGWSKEDARAECARVIAEAEAQCDD